LKNSYKKLIYLIALIFVSCFENQTGRVFEHIKLTDGYKICVFGDSGKNSKSQRLVANQLNTANCQQVRHTGDIIYSAGVENENDPKLQSHFLDYYGSMLDKQIPFYMSLGNHDYKKNPMAWVDVAKLYDAIKFPSNYYFDIFGDICFLTIDTNADFFEQMLWIKQLKKTYAKTCKLTLAIGHHPLYSSGKHGNANLITRIFLEYSLEGYVDAYFAGHDHQLEDLGEINGTRYFISGAAGALRKLSENTPAWAVSKLGYQVLKVVYENGIPKMKFIFKTVDSKTGELRSSHNGMIQRRN